jgi:hypothetical protein
MKSPTLYTLADLADTSGRATASIDGKSWHPARPMGYSSLRNRLRVTWAVFTGCADAVTWPAGQ